MTPTVSKSRTASCPRPSLVPAVAGQRTVLAALTNMLVLVVAVFAGEWILHQLIYRLQYGTRFDSIMATSPHRFYMGPLGNVYGLLAVTTVVLTVGAVARASRRRQALLLLVPLRLRRTTLQVGTSIPRNAVAGTAVLLALSQIALYLVQENLETFASSGIWPGIALVFPAVHPSILPINGVIAIVLSVILWSLSSRLGAAREAVDAVRILVRFFGNARARVPSPIAGFIHVPDLRPRARIVDPRSPPRLA